MAKEVFELIDKSGEELRKNFDPLVLIMLGDPDKNSEGFKKLETLVCNFYSIDEMIKELEGN